MKNVSRCLYFERLLDDSVEMENDINKLSVSESLKKMVKR